MIHATESAAPHFDRATLGRFAWLSIVAALATIVLKAAAYWVTGSVGLLSDALESFVNLAGAMMALWMLSLAARPPDANHAYGHGKAEYFSSGVEGGLILIAAVSIAAAAMQCRTIFAPMTHISLSPRLSQHLAHHIGRPDHFRRQPAAVGLG